MSLTTERLRALCIKHGIHPNAEGKMPRNAWAAINELNDMLPAAGIWPIARLSIDDSGQCAGATLYAPGLPAGEHDVFPAAVAQGSGEPVAFRIFDKDPWGGGDDRWIYYSREDFRDGVDPSGLGLAPLYDAPAPTPAPAWEPLTDEQIAKACDKVICINPAAMTTRDIARAIEADILRRIGAQKGGA